MSALPEFTRLLALALLNYADDHGYFWANPIMIRGAVFPFVERSTIIRRSLVELVTVGYIEIGKAPDGRQGGRIVAFSKHQKIDRPQDSKIKDLISFDDDSSSLRGLFDDHSLLDRKGMEQGTGNGKEGNDVGRAAEAAPASDSEWLAMLESNPAYEGIDVKREHAKAIVWCQTNKKQLTRRRFVAWLGRIERPMAQTRQTSVRPPGLPEPEDWKRWLNEKMPDSPLAKGGATEAHDWNALHRATQQSIINRMNEDPLTH